MRYESLKRLIDQSERRNLCAFSSDWHFGSVKRNASSYTKGGGDVVLVPHIINSGVLGDYTKMHTIVKVGRIYFENRESLSSEKNGQNIRKILSGKSTGANRKIPEVAIPRKVKKNSCCVIPKELIFIHCTFSRAFISLRNFARMRSQESNTRQSRIFRYDYTSMLKIAKTYPQVLRHFWRLRL